MHSSIRNKIYYLLFEAIFMHTYKMIYIYYHFRLRCDTDRLPGEIIHMARPNFVNFYSYI